MDRVSVLVDETLRMMLDRGLTRWEAKEFCRQLKEATDHHDYVVSLTQKFELAEFEADGKKEMVHHKNHETAAFMKKVYAAAAARTIADIEDRAAAENRPLDQVDEDQIRIMADQWLRSQEEYPTSENPAQELGDRLRSDVENSRKQTSHSD